ncbi:hypothetical protein ACFLZQ_07550 [Thermodesulfobacteriota bacterium]
MTTETTNADDIKPGDIYEDCSFHPCLWTATNGQEVWGISLINGSYPRSCDINICGVRKLSVEEALLWKTKGPQNLPDNMGIPNKKRWWQS